MAECVLTRLSRGGVKLLIDGVECKEKEINVKEVFTDVNISTLPYGFVGGAGVVYDNKIHILGGNSTNSNTKHYNYDNYNWNSVSTLPYNFMYSCAVIFNDELHIIGSQVEGNETKHYKWNGTSWTSASTLPYAFYQGCGAVVHNNEIHIIGGKQGVNDYKHYKWDGSEWTSVSKTPNTFYYGASCSYEDEIHVMVLYTNYHYKWDGSSWITVSVLPFTSIVENGMFIFNNEIHIIGGSNSMGHFKWNGTGWTSVGILPFGVNAGAMVVYGNDINIMKGDKHYAIDSTIYYKV